MSICVKNSNSHKNLTIIMLLQMTTQTLLGQSYSIVLLKVESATHTEVHGNNIGSDVESTSTIGVEESEEQCT